METRIGGVSRRIRLFLLGLYWFPPAYAFVFLLVFAPLLVAIRGTNGLVVGLVFAPFAVFLVGLVSYINVCTWQGVVLSARLMGNGNLDFMRLHLRSLRRFLSFNLVEFDEDLMSIAVSKTLGSAVTDPKPNTIDRVLQAVALGFVSHSLFLTREDRRKFFDDYRGDLEAHLQTASTPEKGIVDFLADRFHAAAEGFKDRARSIAPRKGLWEWVEGHRTSINVVLFFVAVGVVVLLGVLHYPVGIGFP